MGPDGAESHGWDLTVLSHTGGTLTVVSHNSVVDSVFFLDKVDSVFKQRINPIVKQVIRFENKFDD